jgi:hypothetical protein
VATTLSIALAQVNPTVGDIIALADDRFHRCAEAIEMPVRTP